MKLPKNNNSQQQTSSRHTFFYKGMSENAFSTDIIVPNTKKVYDEDGNIVGVISRTLPNFKPLYANQPDGEDSLGRIQSP